MSTPPNMSGASGQPAGPTPLIVTVERVHAVVAALAVGVALVVAEQPVWAGLLAGGLIGGLNFRALAWLAVRLLSGRTKSQHAAIGLLLVKFTVLAAAIGAVVLLLRPSALALLVGVSFAPATLVAVALLRNRLAGPGVPPTTAPAALDPEVLR